MSSEMQNIEQNGKGDGKKKLVIGIVVAVMIVLTGAVTVMASLLINANKKVEEPAQEPRKVVTADVAEEIVEDIIAEAQNANTNIPKSYTVTQNGTWTFEDGSSTSNDAYVENDKENETAIYFDLIVDETGEKVYSSPVLELGAVLEKITLDKPLSKGEYECTVEYHLIDDDQNTLTTTNVGVKVVVLN